MKEEETRRSDAQDNLNEQEDEANTLLMGYGLSRREMLKGCVRTGVGVGLAHFFLLGPSGNQPVEAADDCPAPWGPAQDTCRETISNPDPDECFLQGPSIPLHEVGDECNSSSQDNCLVQVMYEVGDVCPDPHPTSVDHCPGYVSPGDICQPSIDESDMCRFFPLPPVGDIPDL